MNSPFVAVVTGSSSGIGQAVAIGFAKKHAALIIHGHQNLRGLHETSQHILTYSRQPSLAIVADITSENSVQQFVQAAFARHGYVDAWIHAAGADVLTGNAKDWSFATKLERLWKTDVAGMIHLSRSVALRMRDQPKRPSLPSMIHIGWDQAEAGFEGDSGQYFCPIKAAVAAFSKSLAKSVAPHVRVNCVGPGWIRTDWGHNASANWNERAMGESLLNRWGIPDDVSNTILWLCSREAEFVNGQFIAVNGGWKSMSLSAKSDTTFGFQ